MSTGKKAEAKGQQAKGKLKETAGKATGNEKMTNEGRADMVEGKAREMKEDAKDDLRKKP